MAARNSTAGGSPPSVGSMLRQDNAGDSGIREKSRSPNPNPDLNPNLNPNVDLNPNLNPIIAGEGPEPTEAEKKAQFKKIMTEMVDDERTSQPSGY